ncbi:MAG TPA: helix-turn-helix transcriptional regulator [Flavobacteriaceae bacterium]|nr:helix-turn-helix transcriptional regulator [Flavobacteriaceae bacterium]
MINSVTFATRLKQLMDYYDLSASAFSDEIDFNRSTISHILSGRNKPSLDFVMKVLHRFPEVTISWFLYGKGDFPSSLESREKEEKKVIQTKEAETRSVSQSKEKTPSISVLQENLSSRAEDNKDSEKRIKRIVIFYSDFSFETYEN